MMGRFIHKRQHGGQGALREQMLARHDDNHKNNGVVQIFDKTDCAFREHARENALCHCEVPIDRSADMADILMPDCHLPALSLLPGESLHVSRRRGREVILLHLNHLNIDSFFILLAFNCMLFAAGMGKLVVPKRAMVFADGRRGLFACLVRRLVSLTAARIANLKHSGYGAIGRVRAAAVVKICPTII
ncbi:MAG: hypothetical protein GPOALKHO_000234 [Sodalis sp.]|nr:MAG: hypothetical protein GPOALKHO_000234 [Sodalis sp.]